MRVLEITVLLICIGVRSTICARHWHLYESSKVQTASCSAVTVVGNRAWNKVSASPEAPVARVKRNAPSRVKRNLGQRACPGSLAQPEVLSAIAGYVSSPGYDFFPYLNGLYCGWMIEAPAGKIVDVSFINFFLEDSVNCANDYVELRDGPTPSSPLIGERLCGTMNNQLKIRSTGNSMFIIFFTNPETDDAGFDFTYFTGLDAETTTEPPTEPPTEATTTPAGLDVSNWCRVTDPTRLTQTAADTSPYFYHVNFRGQSDAEGAVAYNVVDENNFDYVMVRFKDAIECNAAVGCTRQCIQPGYVADGLIYEDEADQVNCQPFSIDTDEAVRVRVEVKSNSLAEFFINLHKFKAITPHFPMLRSVGVVVPVGEGNYMEYRSAQIQDL